MDIHMDRDSNNSYIYDPKNRTTENYDGRYNNAVNKNINAEKYNQIENINKERKVEPIYKKTKIQNLEQEIQYKKIDIWV